MPTGLGFRVIGEEELDFVCMNLICPEKVVVTWGTCCFSKRIPSASLPQDKHLLHAREAGKSVSESQCLHPSIYVYSVLT